MNRLVMSLDGGGTKTVAAVAGLDGTVLALAVAGASNPGFISLADAERAIRRAIGEAVAASGADAGAVVGLAACLSGAMDVRDIVRDMLPGARLDVLPEADVCLASAYESERGAVVLSGTGAFEWAKGPRGTVRTDGLGALLGDEGSAYWLAVAGFAAAGRAIDGRGPETRLSAPLGRAARDLYHSGRSMQRHDVAPAARTVTESALAGDAVAQALCQKAAGRLARGLEVCMRGAGVLDEEVTVALSGSVLRATSAVREPLVARIATFAPNARPLVPVLDPVRGGLLLALRAAGCDWTMPVRSRLEASMQAFPG